MEEIGNSEKIIMGIDPGTNIMGFGVISIDKNKMKFVSMEELNMKNLSDPYTKLKTIFETTLHYVSLHKPDFIAIEAPFYGENVQSMLKLGRAQGVAMAAGLSRQVPICEYLPKKVKMAITGNGNASKEQVSAMVMQLLNLKKAPLHFDQTDALAVAICHYFNSGKTSYEKSYSGWAAFVKANKDRIK